MVLSESRKYILITIGLRNIAQAKDHFRELFFYDIDRPLGHTDIVIVKDYFAFLGLPFILYSTKHGAHCICLSALTRTSWAIIADWFDVNFKSYYSGKTIRLSRKKDESQKLLAISLAGEVIPNLYNLYCERFGLEKMQWTRETSKYILHFERYRTNNE